MVSDDFTRDAVTIHVGQRLTMFNNSNIIHVIGPGRDGHVWGTERNVPVVGFHLFDPVCSAGCPPIGPEFRKAATLLGGSAHQVELIGIVLSPVQRPVSTLRAFDHREGLDHVPGWLYLTGTLSQLHQVWHGYGITAQDLTGAAALHTEEAYVIDAAGRVRQRFSTSPGPGTAAIRSSFAVLFANAARQALTDSGR